MVVCGGAQTQLQDEFDTQLYLVGLDARPALAVPEDKLLALTTLCRRMPAQSSEARVRDWYRREVTDMLPRSAAAKAIAALRERAEVLVSFAVAREGMSPGATAAQSQRSALPRRNAMRPLTRSPFPGARRVLERLQEPLVDGDGDDGPAALSDAAGYEAALLAAAELNAAEEQLKVLHAANNERLALLEQVQLLEARCASQQSTIVALKGRLKGESKWRLSADADADAGASASVSRTNGGSTSQAPALVSTTPIYRKRLPKSRYPMSATGPVRTSAPAPAPAAAVEVDFLARTAPPTSAAVQATHPITRVLGGRPSSAPSSPERRVRASVAVAAVHDPPVHVAQARPTSAGAGAGAGAGVGASAGAGAGAGTATGRAHSGTRRPASAGPTRFGKRGGEPTTATPSKSPSVRTSTPQHGPADAGVELVSPWGDGSALQQHAKALLLAEQALERSSAQVQPEPKQKRPMSAPACRGAPRVKHVIKTNSRAFSKPRLAVPKPVTVAPRQLARTAVVGLPRPTVKPAVTVSVAAGTAAVAAQLAHIGFGDGGPKSGDATGGTTATSGTLNSTAAGTTTATTVAVRGPGTDKRASKKPSPVRMGKARFRKPKRRSKKDTFKRKTEAAAPTLVYSHSNRTSSPQRGVALLSGTFSDPTEGLHMSADMPHLTVTDLGEWAQFEPSQGAVYAVASAGTSAGAGSSAGAGTGARVVPGRSSGASSTLRSTVGSDSRLLRRGSVGHRSAPALRPASAPAYHHPRRVGGIVTVKQQQQHFQ